MRDSEYNHTSKILQVSVSEFLRGLNVSVLRPFNLDNYC